MTVPLSFPDSPEKVNTSLLLYSRQNRNSPLRLDWRSRERNERLNLFRERKPLKLIVHGWQETGDSEWVQEAKDSLLNLEDCNVIVVDWRGGSERGNYIRSAGNTALVGRQGSLLLQHLLTIYRQTLSTEDVHVIGHSLGGQVSGFLGRHFLNQTGVRLGRITALDAAAPLFEDTDVFLSSRDAQFVDAIHTSSGGKVIKGEFGILKPFGHVDFYPNGGQKQPGCPPLGVVSAGRSSVLAAPRGKQARLYFLRSNLSRSSLRLSRAAKDRTRALRRTEHLQQDAFREKVSRSCPECQRAISFTKKELLIPEGTEGVM
ncbi:hypothetical protein V5799_011099 [Amblyomma americanum]|uniref:Lipase domain-containing protein n=1 Tax=Amblyomma americanum TaxID=6943 RepID=A0AAQ4EI92_AMBAM